MNFFRALSAAFFVLEFDVRDSSAATKSHFRSSNTRTIFEKTVGNMLGAESSYINRNQMPNLNYLGMGPPFKSPCALQCAPRTRSTLRRSQGGLVVLGSRTKMQLLAPKPATAGGAPWKRPLPWRPWSCKDLVAATQAFSPRSTALLP